MAESDPERSDVPSASANEPKGKAPGRGDALALGIGCLVFVIFFVAIVVVGAMRG